MNERRTRSTDLTNRLRQGGNQYFAEVVEPFDVAADYYTKAIFSAPKDSVELALAHANRAACCLRMLEFMEVMPFVCSVFCFGVQNIKSFMKQNTFQEGYHDCELALKFNYPIKKRDKLLERKFYLGDNVDQRQTALREMEELVEKKIFTEDQMKCMSIFELFFLKLICFFFSFCKSSTETT